MTISEFTFGNEEKGRVIAAEIAKALQMLRDTKSTPPAPCSSSATAAMSTMIGTRIMAATLWETKVAQPAAKVKTLKLRKAGLVGRKGRMLDTIRLRSWDAVTAFPSTLEPPRRISVCQLNEFRSTSVRRLDPKASARKHKDTMPRSPKRVGRVKADIDQSKIVAPLRRRTTAVSMFAPWLMPPVPCVLSSFSQLFSQSVIQSSNHLVNHSVSHSAIHSITQ
mmetsp:Transcript_57742/g.78726  ORF Transcript_57742/g.78726 Transcript_57742/m.78726 type:complete len:222 (-) Transcript_57742:40-705(-)